MIRRFAGASSLKRISHRNIITSAVKSSQHQGNRTHKSWNSWNLYRRQWIPGALLVAVPISTYVLFKASQSEVESRAAEITVQTPPSYQPIKRQGALEGFLTCCRFVHLFILFIPLIILAPILFLSSNARFLELWCQLLARQMQRAGPTFIKLSQWAASRTDLFPIVFCETLGTMHSAARPHRLKHTQKLLEHAFGMPYKNIFEDFNQSPVGCGAIAQVYTAKLHSDAMIKKDKNSAIESSAIENLLESQSAPVAAEVAIKVLHPRLESKISRDLKIMNFFASAIDSLPGMKWLSLPAEVEEFGQMMYMQLDLRVEAQNLSRFQKNFFSRKNGVTFPAPIQYSKEVLVEEHENALPLKYFLTNGHNSYNQSIASLGLDAFLHMLLVDNFAHSDLHPGNIMIKFSKPTTKDVLRNMWHAIAHPFTGRRDTVHHETDSIVNRLRKLANDPVKWNAALEELHKEGYQPDIVFIDAGLVTELSSTNHRNFLDLFAAIAQFDGARAGNLMVERCRSPDLVLDKEGFSQEMESLLKGVKSTTFTLGKIRIGDVLNCVLGNVRRHHVRMESDFVNTIISILLLEGIGRQLDPNLDVFKSAIPIMREVGAQAGKRGFHDKDARNAQDLLPLAKIWLYLEAREMVSSAFADGDDLMRYDLLMPNV